MQPKIMVLDRPTMAIPTVIVKAASSAYPGLAANEFLCLKAASAAGIATPRFELSNDGQALKMLRLPEADLQRFFEQVALTVYKGPEDVRLSPMFDVVTTSIYRYAGSRHPWRCLGALRRPCPTPWPGMQ